MLLQGFLIYAISACGVLALVKIEARPPEQDSLELVHVLFRHGQRTPDASTIYPNDPHRNETYFPYGVGALTNEGKRTQYNLGRALRIRYDSFLGHVYTPAHLIVQASPISRTRISAQLVLASLFVPSQPEQWNAHLNWQPVDFQSPKLTEDLLFLYMLNCKKFISAADDRIREVLRKGEIGRVDKLFRYLSLNSGWNVTSLEQVFLLHNGLTAEQELGLKLPEWTENVFPEPLRSLSKLYWHYSTDTDLLKTLSGGFLLKRIIDDTQNKINGSESHEQLKMAIYSGHDYTIAALLSALGVFKLHHPPYGAYVLIEVHKMKDRKHGIKVFYQDYSFEQPQQLNLPGCGTPCPFENFLNLYAKYLPTPEMCDVKPS